MSASYFGPLARVRQYIVAIDMVQARRRDSTSGRLECDPGKNSALMTTNSSYIPHTKDEISTEVVQGILRTRFPEATVSSVRLLKEIQGTSSNICLEVRHAGADNLPEVMWLKAGFPKERLDLKLLLSLGLYAKEAIFYSELQPLMNLQVMDCYGALYEEVTGRGVVLLEDLDKPEILFPGYVEPLSVAQVASGLELLADLHGRSWQQKWLYDRKIETFFAPGSRIEQYFRTSHHSSAAYVEECLQGPVGKVVPSEIRDAKRIHSLLWQLQPYYQREPFCLLHGDTHPGNCYINCPTDKVGFLDWQAYVMGPWAQDVTRWIVGSLSVADRRQAERKLVNDYVTRLIQNGVTGLDRNEAWNEYRRFIAYGFFIWIRVPPAQHPIEHNIAQSERFGAAMVDQDVFKLLGV